MVKKREGQAIPGYNNYIITWDGTVYNRNDKRIKFYWYNDKRYIRIYKNGKRHTLSIDKILYELKHKDWLKITLHDEEKVFRYNDTPYLITSFCRAYNTKTKKWLKIIYRNGTPTINVSNNGRVEVVSLLKFLKTVGGQIE